MRALVLLRREPLSQCVFTEPFLWEREREKSGVFSLLIKTPSLLGKGPNFITSSNLNLPIAPMSKYSHNGRQGLDMGFGG